MALTIALFGFGTLSPSSLIYVNGIDNTVLKLFSDYFCEILNANEIETENIFGFLTAVYAPLFKEWEALPKAKHQCDY